MSTTDRIRQWWLWWPGSVYGLTWRERRRMARICRNAARIGARAALAHLDRENGP